MSNPLISWIEPFEFARRRAERELLRLRPTFQRLWLYGLIIAVLVDVFIIPSIPGVNRLQIYLTAIFGGYAVLLAALAQFLVPAGISIRHDAIVDSGSGRIIPLSKVLSLRVRNVNSGSAVLSVKYELGNRIRRFTIGIPKTIDRALLNNMAVCG